VLLKRHDLESNQHLALGCLPQVLQTIDASLLTKTRTPTRQLVKGEHVLLSMLMHFEPYQGISTQPGIAAACLLSYSVDLALRMKKAALNQHHITNTHYYTEVDGIGAVGGTSVTVSTNLKSVCVPANQCKVLKGVSGLP